MILISKFCETLVVVMIMQIMHVKMEASRRRTSHPYPIHTVLSLSFFSCHLEHVILENSQFFACYFDKWTIFRNNKL